MNTAKCPKCGKKMVSSGTFGTCVYFNSPAGHNHDDNCRSRYYVCNEGCNYTMHVNKRNTCPVCDWKGKESCLCCGDKVDEWPEEYVLQL